MSPVCYCLAERATASEKRASTLKGPAMGPLSRGRLKV